MIVIAISSFIVRKGLADIIKELYPGKKIMSIGFIEELNFIQEKNNISLLLASAEILSNIDLYLLKDIQLIKLINSRPDYIETDNINSELLFLDDTESAILHILKRNLALMDKNSSGSKPESVLSDRELDIVREVALGNTNKEIADKLFISAHTVITHRKNITRKLGIKTVSGLTVYALLNKLIKMSDSL
ncbi:MAG: helix-turn-helix transcriptional regulator [Bacteroidales bacterium]|jgi:DNA-binding CsgD family transcriptional regulator|nr:helix-turn-helix transcriptional regulator [Bacteroidales bacterium]